MIPEEEAPRPRLPDPMSSTRTAQLASLAEQADLRYLPLLDHYYDTLSCQEARRLCRQAAFEEKAAIILILDRLARSKQNPFNRGHGARFLFGPPASSAICCL